MVPEFVSDPKHQVGLNDINELFCGFSAIHGQVTDDICPGIAFSYFISGGGEEAHQDAVTRIIIPDEFQQWPALFKLAQ